MQGTFMSLRIRSSMRTQRFSNRLCAKTCCLTFLGASGSRPSAVGYGALEKLGNGLCNNNYKHQGLVDIKMALVGNIASARQSCEYVDAFPGSLSLRASFLRTAASLSSNLQD